ncbi:MAG: flagellar motor switch protein FliM [Bryobacteraceae bacterium]|nr:flagellar motor switch protein FliM [Bryobacteraceae bacterium]
MSLDRVLSQQEIDSVFKRMQKTKVSDDPAKRAQPYDFRRPDRIAKDQLRSIHLLHENFARSLASSLSAYLRAYVMVNLVSVEQISFLEFTQCLPSPSCIVSMAMKPFDANAILEMNPTIVYPVLEMLLGGSGKTRLKVDREITEIEQSLLDGVLRIVLHDLEDAWSPITPMNFQLEKHETEPQLLQILSPSEAVVAVGIEIRIGELAGMMNVGIPSIIIKMLRQKFDQQWSVRKAEASEEDRQRALKLLLQAQVKFDSRLQGPTMTIQEVLQMSPGDVLAFDYPLDRPVDLLVNGRLLFQGRIVDTGLKRAFSLDSINGRE